MQLIFQLAAHTIHYAFLTEDKTLVHSDTVDFKSRSIRSAFEHDVVLKLRTHGKVTTHIGFILPFGSTEYHKPALADKKIIQLLMNTELRKQILHPYNEIFQLIIRTWPHVPCYFLFDTHLTDELPRDVTQPPFSFNIMHQFKLEAQFLTSYGHQANMMSAPTNKKVISLYLEEVPSVGVFHHGQVIDGTISFSPYPSQFGHASTGQLDSGTYTELAEKVRVPKMVETLLKESGINALIEGEYTVDQLLEISGLIPRKNNDLVETLSIENIEVIEIATKKYIREIRKLLGAYLAIHPDCEVVVCNLSGLEKESPFWKFIKPLHGVKFVLSDNTALQAAHAHLLNHVSIVS